MCLLSRIKCLLVVWIFLATLAGNSQNEASQWYFGNQAGLNFLTNPPTAHTVSAMLANYGCASMADASGNLLFYTNGQNVYTSTHTVMANGSGLNGYQYNSQPALIIKRPGSASQYYLFTLNSINNINSSPGLFYSLIDMSLASGQGSVTTKNVPVYSGNSSGKLTGTKHCNGVDYWVVIRDWTTSTSTVNFLAYQVTSTGVSTTAVVSAASTWTNTNYSYYDQYGCMKISPNGRKLALANYNNYYYYNQQHPTYEVWDFNNSTGAVTNSIGLSVNTNTVNYWNGGWGVEFSPDCTKLYGSRLNWNVNNVAISQWDLCAGSASAVVASESVIATHTSSSNNGHGSMQLAPNGKIYIANWWSVTNSQHISVINNPNLAGAACNYSYLAQSVAPNNSTYSMPNFIGSHFAQPPPVAPFTFSVSNGFGCQAAAFVSPVAPNTTVSSCATIGYSLTGLLWNFGDPASGVTNTSTAANPVHAFTSLGTYTVQLVLYYSCGGGTDTLKQVVNINQPCISVSSTSITCASLGSATVSSTGGIGPFSFTWMPSGQTSSVATGLSPGTYTLTVFDFGNNFTYTATTVFTSLIPLTGNLVHESSVTCHSANTASATVTSIGGGSGSQSFWWSNGSTTYTTPLVNTLSAGVWSVLVTDNLTGCTIQDLFMVTQPPALSLVMTGSSPSVCAGGSVALGGQASGGIPGFTYSWSAGPASDTYTVSSVVAGSQIYTLSATDSNTCTVTNTIAVSYVPNPVLSLPTVSICPLETGILQVSGASTYEWFDSSTLSTYTASPPVTSSYSVIGSALGCTTAASGTIVVKPLPLPMYSNNSPRCNGETLNLFALGGQSYFWSGPQNFTSTAQNPVLPAVSPANSGQYAFTVTAANGCTAALSGSVIVHPTPTLTVLGSTVCVAQNMLLFANSVPGASYNWSGPQSFGSTQQNPVVSSPSVNMTGNYQVLVHSAQGCSNTAVAHASVTAMPVPAFVTNSPLCDGAALNFNSAGTTGAVNYSWSGPDNFSSQAQNPSISQVSMQSAGYYTLVVTTGPCVAGIVQPVIVNPLPVPVISGPASVCETKSIALAVNAPGHQIINYQWVFPSGISSLDFVSIDSSTTSNSGVYSATVTDNNGCRGSVSRQIVILNNPLVSAIGDTVCLNQPARLRASGAGDYVWYGPNLHVNTGAQALVGQAANVFPETYVVVGTAINGCTAITSAEVHTSKLPSPGITVAPQETLCLNAQLQLTGSGGVSYEWHTPAGHIYRGAEVSLIMQSMALAGNYTVVATDKFGCSNSTTKYISLTPLPEGSLYADKWESCVPFCSQFNFKPAGAARPWSGSWVINQKKINSENFSYCFDKPGNYTITGSFTDNISGCANSQTYHVQAYSNPEASFKWEPEKPVETFDEVKFYNTSSGEEQKNWTWHIEGVHGRLDQENFSSTFRDAGNYRVVLVVENKWGCSDTSINVVEVKGDFSFYVPDVFTPGNDGTNDIFKPVTRGVTKYRLEIFNRWGERLFLSLNPEDGWDGTFQGKICKADSYVWNVVLTTSENQQKEYKGHVILYR